MKKLVSFILISGLVFAGGCGRKDAPQYAAPAAVGSTGRMMKIPGFWISRQAFADKLVLDEEGVRRFNRKSAVELKLTKDLCAIGLRVSGRELKGVLAQDLAARQKEIRFDKTFVKVSEQFYLRIKRLMSFETIPPEIEVRHGFIYRYADQRLLPTDEVLTAEPGDFEFDELQNSSLDIGTPLVILHESSDGSWVYCHTASSSGWVKKDAVVFCSLGEFKDFLNAGRFGMVVSSKADIFFDPGLTRYYDYARMGSRFPVEDVGREVMQIVLPFPDAQGSFTRRTAYLRVEDAHEGNLTYTARTIIQQAFKLLNAPYGWGGMDGEQDCSGFLQEIFATVGIVLPRNSPEQGKVGRLVAEFGPETADAEKINVLETKALGGISIIQLKGHVVLYLGFYNGVPYAIHEMHAYSRGTGSNSRKYILNRTVVSDLFLGKGSKKGSLLERAIVIREID